MSTATAAPAMLQPKGSLVVRFAQRFGVEPEKMMTTLKQTAFRSDKEISNEAMMALLVVADQYNLNPWTNEIYAFPGKRGGIVPVVGVDGWARIVNEHQQYDGFEFTDGPLNQQGVPDWIECTFFRKDRQHAAPVREYFAECKRNTEPWASHPRRMLRHKAFIQAARLAFGFVGIYDEDEARRIIEGEAARIPERSAVISAINAEVSGKTPEAEIQGSGLSFAEIASQINKAETGADFELAADLIRSHKDYAQRDELQAVFDARQKELAALAAKRKA